VVTPEQAALVMGIGIPAGICLAMAMAAVSGLVMAHLVRRRWAGR
jgi:hypothetical protein